VGTTPVAITEARIERYNHNNNNDRKLIDLSACNDSFLVHSRTQIFAIPEAAIYDAHNALHK
jgi:hypothetical protein